MTQVVKRHFYALDLILAIDSVCDACHTRASRRQFPTAYLEQSSESPADIGVNFAADVMRRNKQLILLLRESVTSYTVAQIIPDEKSDTLRDTLLQLCMELHPLDRPIAVIRVDPAPGLRAIRGDKTLDHFRISIEVDHVKNPDKNPVAEEAISELENELLKQDPGGGHHLV